MKTRKQCYVQESNSLTVLLEKGVKVVCTWTRESIGRSDAMNAEIYLLKDKDEKKNEM
jgi:hypothetical protein